MFGHGTKITYVEAGVTRTRTYSDADSAARFIRIMGATSMILSVEKV